MWMDKEFQHRRCQDTHDVTFWNDNSASHIDKANKARIEIRHGIYTTEWSFKWPEEKDDLEKVERMLRLAFEMGQRAKIEEFKRIMDIKDPRR